MLYQNKRHWGPELCEHQKINKRYIHFLIGIVVEIEFTFSLS